MFWFLVFAALLMLLAWQSLRLSHATGVLGIALLFYGWLGESGGRFVLLLIAYLAIFVPLNTPALRQEWISRVILDALLQRLPPLPKAEAKPASCLLEGDWSRQLPPAAEPLPPTALAREAMAAALQHRLAAPLQPPRPDAVQATIATALYASAALDGIDADCQAGQASPALAALRHALQWQLAEASATLGGTLPAAFATQAFNRPTEDWLLATAQAAHGPYRATLLAAHDDNPHTALIAFDTAFFQWLRQAISQAVRALVNGLALGQLFNPPAALTEEPVIALHRTAALAQTRLAVLTNLLLAVTSFGHSKAAFALVASLQAALAKALPAQTQVQALLQFHGRASAPNLEQPLLLEAASKALREAEAASWQAVQEVPSWPLRLALRGLLFPLGRSAPAGDSRRQAECAKALITHREVRARLLPGDWSAPLSGLAERCELLNKLAGPLQQLALAKLEPPPASDAEWLQQALRMAFVSPQQHEVLVAALAFAQTHRPNAPPGDATP